MVFLLVSPPILQLQAALSRCEGLLQRDQPMLPISNPTASPLPALDRAECLGNKPLPVAVLASIGSGAERSGLFLTTQSSLIPDPALSPAIQYHTSPSSTSSVALGLKAPLPFLFPYNPSTHSLWDSDLLTPSTSVLRGPASRVPSPYHSYLFLFLSLLTHPLSLIPVPFIPHLLGLFA